MLFEDFLFLALAAILFNGAEPLRPSWISDRHSFSSFQSRNHPVATEHVLAQGDQRFGKRCRKLIYKMAAVAAILDFLSTHLANLCLLSTLMLIIMFQFKWIIKRCPKYEFSTFFPILYRAHTNAWRSKFDLAVKRSNINVGPSLQQVR